LVGGFAQGNIHTTSGADVQKQIALNFETAYFVAKPLLQHFQDKGSGRLVFIGARPALNPTQGKDLLAYALSKSLLFKLAEFINEDNKGKNITATVVVPSTIDTPLNRKYSSGINFEDWVKPEQLAETIEFVVSDKGSALRETVLKMYNNS
jgi:NAD(P)-dependent dehydrogenase (short-subunit alcohol dehydrogenase family)